MGSRIHGKGPPTMDECSALNANGAAYIDV